MARKLALFGLVIGLALALTAGSAGAATYYVAIGGSGSGGAGDPFGSVRAALGAASANDTILVGAGTFNDAAENFTANQRIVVSTKVTLLGGFTGAASGWNASDVFGSGTRTGTTTIDAQDQSTILRVDAAGTVVDGFTLKDGARQGAGDELGIGLRVEARARLSHLDVTSNTSYSLGDGGGGIYFGADADYSVLEYSTVRDNSTYASGSGIAVASGCDGAMVANSVVYGNDSAKDVTFYNAGNPTVIFGSLFYNAGAGDKAIRPAGAGYTTYLINCTLADNQTDGDVDAYYHHNGTTNIRNAIFSNNGQADDGIFLNASYGTRRIGDVMFNNDVIDTTGSYTDEGGITTDDPLFVGGGDYNLQGASPAANVGGYLLAMTSAEKSAAFGADAVGYAIYYVNVNDEEATDDYDALTDVIVSLGGYTVTADEQFDVDGYYRHFIYTTDLAGNDRLTGASIDLGAYELAVPEPATLAFLAAGGLAMAGGAIRRRRRA